MKKTLFGITLFSLAFLVIFTSSISYSNAVIYWTNAQNKTNLSDSYVLKSSDSNFGTSQDLITYNSPVHTSRSYLRFNISGVPSTATINNALVTLNLYWNEQTDNDKDTPIHEVFQDWSENGINGITWNNQPCGTDFNNSGNCNLTPEMNVTANVPQNYTWNVSNMVKRALLQGYKNVSFVIKRTDENTAGQNNHIYRSRENTDQSNSPTLMIDFTPIVTVPAPQATFYTATLIAKNTATSPVLSKIYKCVSAMSASDAVQQAILLFTSQFGQPNLSLQAGALKASGIGC